jgi:signal transduction histidine kinase
MNAIDACDKEERYIHIGVTKKYGYIRIAISDNGKGIPEKHIRHIFKPFWSTKSHAKGMGMGLSTVQMIVEDECRGTVEVQSKEREGTSVILTLPPSLTKKKRRIE